MSGGGMFDPFSAWSRMVSAGLDMQSTWLRSAETMRASGDVIGTRTEMMRAATAAPLTGNYAELSRMAPEKVAAFSRSAEVIARDTMAMHSAWIGQMQRVGMMMLAGRMPSAGEVATLANQSANYAIGAMTAGARMGKGALAPVHRTATGNARRLRRTRTR
jgi:ABC-type taurine transport system substrate-binding protein